MSIVNKDARVSKFPFNDIEDKSISNNKSDSDPLFVKYSRKKAGRVLNNNSRILATGLNAYSGTLTDSDAAHLLKRLSYGAIKTDIDAIKLLSPSAAIDKMLTFLPQPTVPYPYAVNYYEADEPDAAGAPLGSDITKTHLLDYTNAYSILYFRLESIKNHIMGVYLNDPVSIREKMTDFWYHFIPVNYNSVVVENSYSFINDYRVLLRSNCLGNFKTLIKAIAKSQAMLLYLNGQDSYPDTPNENFARELFELFTIGKEVNPANQKYTEADIKAASKIFSGWRMESYLTPYPIPVAFNYEYHNQEDKQFSVNFGNTLIANQLGADGANEFDLFFDMLFTYQGNTIAKYICRRLYRFFVYYEITPQIETDIIEPLASLFVTSNWDIKPIVEKLFKSEHFFDIANRGVMIKSPIDFVVGAIRTLKVETNYPLNEYRIQNEVWSSLRGFCSYHLEQGIGDVPTVSGWKAYYQEPSFYQIWINSITIQRREYFLDNLLFYDLGSPIMLIDPIVYVKQFPNETIKNPNTLIDAMVVNLLPTDLDPIFKSENLKKANLLNFQENDNYWTNAWNNYIATPNDEVRKKLVEERLRAVLNVILKLAEFQLM
jgi:Protein of unknown function (DUF1800)